MFSRPFLSKIAISLPQRKTMETGKSTLCAQLYNSTFIFQNIVHRGERRTFSRIINKALKSIFYSPDKNFRILENCVSTSWLCLKYQGGWQSKNCYTIVITPSVHTALTNFKHTWDYYLFHGPKTCRGKNDCICCLRNWNTDYCSVKLYLTIYDCICSRYLRKRMKCLKEFKNIFCSINFNIYFQIRICILESLTCLAWWRMKLGGARKGAG